VPAAKIGWLSTLRPRFLKAPSVVVLILANLVPLTGVLFWGWDLLTLMLLYWMETGIIGVFAIIHMAIVARWWALYLVPFFVIHFGGFMFGHLFFLLALFGSGQVTNDLGLLLETLRAEITQRGLWLPFAALCISHGVSFVLNVLRKAKPVLSRYGVAREEESPQRIMVAPYGRVVLMHLTIIFGAIIAQAFGSKVWAFALLVVLKITVDVAAHVRKNFGG
jgi:Family of unknown function (DUF6498)